MKQSTTFPLKWFEITLAGNSRPGYSEDNMIIISDSCLEDAIHGYNTLRKEGKIVATGDIRQIREIFYVYPKPTM